MFGSHGDNYDGNQEAKELYDIKNKFSKIPNFIKRVIDLKKTNIPENIIMSNNIEWADDRRVNHRIELFLYKQNKDDKGTLIGYCNKLMILFVYTI